MVVASSTTTVLLVHYMASVLAFAYSFNKYSCILTAKTFSIKEVFYASQNLHKWHKLWRLRTANFSVNNGKTLVDSTNKNINFKIIAPPWNSGDANAIMAALDAYHNGSNVDFSSWNIGD